MYSRAKDLMALEWYAYVRCFSHSFAVGRDKVCCMFTLVYIKTYLIIYSSAV